MKSVNTLVEQPGSGQSGCVPGTRESVAPRTRYIVPYRVLGDAFETLRVSTRRGDCRSGGSNVNGPQNGSPIATIV